MILILFQLFSIYSQDYYTVLANIDFLFDSSNAKLVMIGADEYLKEGGFCQKLNASDDVNKECLYLKAFSDFRSKILDAEYERGIINFQDLQSAYYDAKNEVITDEKELKNSFYRYPKYFHKYIAEFFNYYRVFINRNFISNKTNYSKGFYYLENLINEEKNDFLIKFYFQILGNIMDEYVRSFIILESYKKSLDKKEKDLFVNKVFNKLGFNDNEILKLLNSSNINSEQYKGENVKAFWKERISKLYDEIYRWQFVNGIEPIRKELIAIVSEFNNKLLKVEDDLASYNKKDKLETRSFRVKHSFLLDIPSYNIYLNSYFDNITSGVGILLLSKTLKQQGYLRQADDVSYYYYKFKKHKNTFSDEEIIEAIDELINKTFNEYNGLILKAYEYNEYLGKVKIYDSEASFTKFFNDIFKNYPKAYIKVIADDLENKNFKIIDGYNEIMQNIISYLDAEQKETDKRMSWLDTFYDNTTLLGALSILILIVSVVLSLFFGPLAIFAYIAIASKVMLLCSATALLVVSTFYTFGTIKIKSEYKKQYEAFLSNSAGESSFIEIQKTWDEYLEYRTRVPLTFGEAILDATGAGLVKDINKLRIITKIFKDKDALLFLKKVAGKNYRKLIEEIADDVLKNSKKKFTNKMFTDEELIKAAIKRKFAGIDNSIKFEINKLDDILSYLKNIIDKKSIYSDDIFDLINDFMLGKVGNRFSRIDNFENIFEIKSKLNNARRTIKVSIVKDNLQILETNFLKNGDRIEDLTELVRYGDNFFDLTPTVKYISADGKKVFTRTLSTDEYKRLLKLKQGIKEACF